MRDKKRTVSVSTKCGLNKKVDLWISLLSLHYQVDVSITHRASSNYTHRKSPFAQTLFHRLDDFRKYVRCNNSTFTSFLQFSVINQRNWNPVSLVPTYWLSRFVWESLCVTTINLAAGFYPAPFVNQVCCYTLVSNILLETIQYPLRKGVVLCITKLCL